MKTKHFFEKDLSKAAELIKNGEIVAFPTDTVYGLGADARNNKAVQKIFLAKERPAARALTVLIAKKEDLDKYAQDIPKEAWLLVNAFWPGPLTIVLKKKEIVAPSVTANLDTIGLRMPSNSLALNFIKECGVPLAAPSANSTGRPSPTTAAHVFDDLNGKISGIIDGGETPLGIESTVLDLSEPKRPIILRPGGITKIQIEEIIKKKVATIEQDINGKHYEPVIPLYIVESSWTHAIQKMLNNREQIGILADEEVLSNYENQVAETYSLGEKGDFESASKNFFKGLRSLEQSNATVILAEGMDNDQSSEAYMNRLKKAANNKKI